MRNEVLEKVGTKGFSKALENAIQEEKRKFLLKKYERSVAAFATKIEDSSNKYDKYKYVTSYDCYNEKEIESSGVLRQIAGRLFLRSTLFSC